MKTIAIIPARGGSKGIPRKNLQKVGGVPLVVRAVTACLDAERVDTVVVTTDDKEIAEVAHKAGAYAILQPPEVSTDESSSESALLWALEQMPGYDVLAFVQCTSPFVTGEDIDGTLGVLSRDSVIDSAFAALPFHGHVWLDGDGVNHFPNDRLPNNRLRRQDRHPEQLESGSVYACRIPGFVASKYRFFGAIGHYIIPTEGAIEIDTPADLLIACQLAPLFDGKSNLAKLPKTVSNLILDFDGVLTDSMVITDRYGKESVVCDRGDSLGIQMVQEAGVKIFVLSTEEDEVVAARCRKLGVGWMNGCLYKAAALKDEDTDLPATVYLGNDVNDLGAMEIVGCPVATADAHPEVKRAAKIILTKPGGRGAVRELCDMILENMQ